MLVLAHQYVRADLRAATDQALRLERGERFANGVTEDEEIRRQLLLDGSPSG